MDSNLTRFRLVAAGVVALVVVAAGLAWLTLRSDGGTGSHPEAATSTQQSTAQSNESPSAAARTGGTDGTAQTVQPSARPKASGGAKSPSPSAASSSDKASVSGAAPYPTAKPVGLDDVARTDNGGAVQLVKIESVTSEARLPGELSRPAVRVTVKFTAKDTPIDLDMVVVNGYYGSDQTPALPASNPGGVSVSGTLKPGSSTTGVYLFNVPESDRGQVRIEVGYAAASPMLVFQGAVN